MKILKKKFILLCISAIFLITVVIYGTLAWYTKMVSVAGLEFEVAKWDFTANQIMGDMNVNVYQYSTLAVEGNPNARVAAPGTAGYIPITLSAGESQTDIEYYITVDESSMSIEFQERLTFFFENENKVLVEFKNEGNDLVGILEVGNSIAKEKTVFIYWEWIYELKPELGVDQTYTVEQLEEIDKNNEFDTKVGKNPAIYIEQMNATVKIAGTQVIPEVVEPVQ